MKYSGSQRRRSTTSLCGSVSRNDVVPPSDSMAEPAASAPKCSTALIATTVRIVSGIPSWGRNAEIARPTKSAERVAVALRLRSMSTSKSNTPRAPVSGRRTRRRWKSGSNQFSTSYSPWMSMTSAFVKTGGMLGGCASSGRTVMSLMTPIWSSPSISG